jgi:hypothetical protein
MELSAANARVGSGCWRRKTGTAATDSKHVVNNSVTPSLLQTLGTAVNVDGHQVPADGRHQRRPCPQAAGGVLTHTRLVVSISARADQLTRWRRSYAFREPPASEWGFFLGSDVTRGDRVGYAWCSRGSPNEVTQGSICIHTEKS